MTRSNARNIRIFNDWFGIDNKSIQEESSLCELLYNKYPHEYGLAPDKTGFWVEQKNFYYRHKCNNGKYFNYPIEISKDFSIGDSKIIKIDRIYIGKIAGAAQQKDLSSLNDDDPQRDAHLLKMAEEDLAKNPLKEHGFDWEHLKTSMEGEA